MFDPAEPPLRAYVVLDFEATCVDGGAPDPQEIIELPSVLLDGATLEPRDEFESFVRPLHHPTLTAFCKELTTIRQADVDAAAPFREVLDAHLAWLRGHGLATRPEEGPRDWAFVVCGDWDLGTMLPRQALACAPPLETIPWPYRRWINVKRPFAAWAQPERRPPGMPGMLAALGLELEGTHHRGIDDCRNIAKIARALAAKGQLLSFTSAVPPSRYPPIDVVLERDGAVQRLRLEKRALETLLGGASQAFGRRVKRAWRTDGAEVTRDEHLFDSTNGARLRVS